MTSLSTQKLPIPSFLKMLTSGGMPMIDAMAAAKKIYASHPSPALLSELDSVKLIELNIDDKDHRKTILAAVKKAGYVKPRSPSKVNGEDDDLRVRPQAGPSTARLNKRGSSSTKPSQTSGKRKRTFQGDLEPGSPSPDEAEVDTVDDGRLDFGELLDEGALMTKSTYVNRAPVMTAWATVVAERLGFKRAEALSIASVYTELNATSKGVSIGVFDASKHKDHETGSSQPFVELMGRKYVPVVEKEDGEWRAIIKGSPVDPSAPFGYIHRAFRQTTSAVLGAMQLLANSFEPAELNGRGYGLYCDFRPGNEGWGKKAEMRMRTILELRNSVAVVEVSAADNEQEMPSEHTAEVDPSEVPPAKKLKTDDAEL